MTNLQEATGAYGPAWETGVLVDHAHRLVDATVRVFASGAVYAVPSGGGAPVPVVCGDLIELHTEDGPMSGRCGAPVDGDRGACAGHADEQDRYRSMSEIDRYSLELREEFAR